MQFLTPSESAAWCSTHGHEPSPGRRDVPAADMQRLDFQIPVDAGARVALCRMLWQHAHEGDHQERLLLVEGWGVWPSGEHPPLFSALRAAYGERRTLMEAPGHLFGDGETDEGLSFLIVCALFLWDCRLLGTDGSAIVLSHDEYGMAFVRPGQHSSDLEAQLAQLEVLVVSSGRHPEIMLRLRRFWFSFDLAQEPRCRPGCGVTAWTREDALAILERLIPEDMKAIAGCIEDVDVSTLDPQHVLPNIGDVTVRGIWFPGGFFWPPPC